jgi:coenzyme F420 hydrogenase subunit beta
MNNIQQVVQHDLCISCGACAVAAADPVDFVERKGIFVPDGKVLKDTNLLKYCPGKGYEIIKMGQDCWGKATEYDIDIGRYKSFVAARSTSSEVCKNASSGGVITAILLHLLDSGSVSGAVVTKFEYGKHGPTPVSYIARNKSELLDSQGSKYCPVVNLKCISAVKDFDGTVAWVGTPCQIAGLRLRMQDDQQLRKKIKFTVANFCGGFRDYREARRLVALCGETFKDVTDFRYRGGGQPGFMRVKTREGNVYKLPYPDYAKKTGYTKLKRCRLCVDATGELADFSCGDAWIPRFLATGEPWSIIIMRSEAAMDIIKQMKATNDIVTQDISIGELKRSQYDNLLSKKTRQQARRKLYALLRGGMPVFDGGYRSGSGGLLKEMRIHCQYAIFSLLEKMRLYKYVAKLIGRYR